MYNFMGDLRKNGINRREFLGYAGGLAGLALAGCEEEAMTKKKGLAENRLYNPFNQTLDTGYEFPGGISKGRVATSGAENLTGRVEGEIPFYFVSYPLHSPGTLTFNVPPIVYRYSGGVAEEIARIPNEFYFDFKTPVGYITNPEAAEEDEIDRFNGIDIETVLLDSSNLLISCNNSPKLLRIGLNDGSVNIHDEHENIRGITSMFVSIDGRIGLGQASTDSHTSRVVFYDPSTKTFYDGFDIPVGNKGGIIGYGGVAIATQIKVAQTPEGNHFASDFINNKVWRQNSQGVSPSFDITRPVNCLYDPARGLFVPTSALLSPSDESVVSRESNLYWVEEDASQVDESNPFVPLSIDVNELTTGSGSEIQIEGVTHFAPSLFNVSCFYDETDTHWNFYYLNPAGGELNLIQALKDSGSGALGLVRKS